MTIPVSAVSPSSLSFGQQVFGTVVEPGFFRTEVLVEGSSTIWPELSIEDYAERTAATIERGGA